MRLLVFLAALALGGWALFYLPIGAVMVLVALWLTYEVARSVRKRKGWRDDLTRAGPDQPISAYETARRAQGKASWMRFPSGGGGI